MTLRLLTTTKLFVLASIIGLMMAVSATSHGQAIDASPPELAESAADAAAIEVPNDESGVAEAAEAEATAEVDAIQVNPAKEDPIGTGTAMVQAFKDGAWLVGFGFALLLAVFFTRESLIFFKVAWAKTKPGGFIIAFGLAEGTAFGLAFSVGAGFSWALLVAASGAAWLAAGQHGHIRDVIDWVRGVEKVPKAIVVKN